MRSPRFVTCIVASMVLSTTAVLADEDETRDKWSLSDELSGETCGLLTKLEADRVARARDSLCAAEVNGELTCEALRRTYPGTAQVFAETGIEFKVEGTGVLKCSETNESARSNEHESPDATTENQTAALNSTQVAKLSSRCSHCRWEGEEPRRLPRCAHLARAQAELSATANRLLLRRADILKGIDDAEEKLTPAKQTEITCLETLLERISQFVEVPDAAHLFLGFDDYSDHFYGFHLGFEYATLSDVLGDSALPRTGFLVTTRFRGSEPQDRIGRSVHYGSHLILQAQLTSSGEERIVLEPNDDGNGNGDGGTEEESRTEAVPKEPQQSLEFELAWFKPFYSSWATTKEGRRLKHMTGFLGLIGGRKSDESPSADRRYYAGVRFALNPELYGDILFGRTESLESWRAELRGQLPVFRLSKGSRLYLGAIGNFGIDSERKEQRSEDDKVTRPAEPDSIRIYLSFETDVQDLFNF